MQPAWVLRGPLCCCFWSSAVRHARACPPHTLVAPATRAARAGMSTPLLLRAAPRPNGSAARTGPHTQDSVSFWLIVGLGNPGSQYQGTRHNVGFRLVETLAQQAGCSVDKQQHQALVGRGILWSHRVLLAKPTTFMNLSGKAVVALAQYYKVPRNQVLVVSDDLDLAPGVIRLRAKGGHGGHNGMRSIIQHWGGQTDFPRLRIGIGRPAGKQDAADYVLQGFGKHEAEEVDIALRQAVDVVQALLQLGMEKALSGVRVASTS